MSKHQLKSTIRRGAIFGAVFALVAATFAPAASTYADALNPLTERSLTLSSSSPGWSFLDASGNGTYAPPNSGANGNKAGNTFSFRVSSTAEVQAMTFQYCTTPAGNCMGPGNNTSTGVSPAIDRAANGQTMYNDQRSDLEIVTSSPSEVTTFDTKFDAESGQPAPYDGGGQYNSNNAHPNVPARDNSEGNFIVLSKAPTDTDWHQIEGWDMVASVNQTYDGDPGLEGEGHSTGKNNFITLTNDTDSGTLEDIDAGDYVKVIFFGTDTNYITNPGDREFFVKINTYSDHETQDETTLIDGGVTVANVMNRSIEIQTKVLETMDFSVGTVDPNTLDSGDGDGTEAGPSEDPSQFTLATGKNQHGPCDAIATAMNTSKTERNVLRLGDEDGEFSLRTDTAYTTHSYWRLSSNSSGGATVYYSGVTLSNTVGDQINAIGTTAQPPIEGSEQFGLALATNETPGVHEVNYTVERNGGLGVFESAEDNDTNGIHATTTAEVGSNPSYHVPRLHPLVPDAQYDNGAGSANIEYGTLASEFAFDPESTVIPAPFATGTEVLDCVTGKMRYIANIAATTPAGIYTTKINYIAAPQY